MENNFIQEEITSIFIEKMQQKFQEKFGNYSIKTVENGKELNFSITFDFYSYFFVDFHFKNGEIYFSVFDIKETEGIRLRNSQSDYENLDMNRFLEEFQAEIELRIPDKFLKYKGWLK